MLGLDTQHQKKRQTCPRRPLWDVETELACPLTASTYWHSRHGLSSRHAIVLEKWKKMVIRFTLLRGMVHFIIFYYKVFLYYYIYLMRGKWDKAATIQPLWQQKSNTQQIVRCRNKNATCSKLATVTTNQRHTANQLMLQQKCNMEQIVHCHKINSHRKLPAIAIKKHH